MGRREIGKEFILKFLVTLRGKQLCALTWDRCLDFLKIFAEKFGKKSAFLTQIKGNSAEKIIITLVFEKNAKIFAENGQKSQKIVITTSVLG
jgi:hypothetical protein